MRKNEYKFSGKEKKELKEERLDGVSGGKDYEIYEEIYKDSNGKIFKIEKTTKTYSNSGKFLNKKTEVIYY